MKIQTVLQHNFLINPTRAVALALLAAATLAQSAAARQTLDTADQAADKPPVSVYSPHSKNPKFVLFNSPTGIAFAGSNMGWFYRDTNRPAAYTKDSVIAQIQASMAKWSAVCNITFTYAGETTTGFSQLAGNFDEVNVIGWDTTGMSAPTTGIASVAWTGATVTVNGVSRNPIFDAEIRLNHDYLPTLPLEALDNTITHEVGHAIGLQHSDVQGQLMSGPPLTTYVNGMTGLGADDIAGCVALYGAPGGPPPTCTPPQPANEQQNLSCPAGQTGTITQQRSYTCVGTNWTPGAFQTIANTCVAATCTPPQPANEQQMLACPAGQTGSITQQRSYTCVGTTWTPGTYQTIANTCTTPCVGPQPADDTQMVGCPAGTTGSITQRRTYTCLGGAWTPGQYQTIANTCTAPPCMGPQPANDQQTLACPSGQAGSILQQRTYSCIGGAWTPGNFQTITNSCTQSGAPANHQGAWWAGSAENGWGLALTQHSNVLVAGWYYYGNNGQPTWSIMPGCNWNATFTSCTGQIITSSSTWLGTYSSAAYQQLAAGTVTFTFSGANAGTMQWTVGGVPGSKSISKLNFGSGVAPSGVDYTDVWWGGSSQNGWGVALTQEGAVLVGSWYTYNQGGQPVWYLINPGTWTTPTVYTTTLLRSTGSPLIGATYNPTLFTPTVAGSLVLTFTSNSTATMTYTVDGVTQAKEIVRFPF